MVLDVRPDSSRRITTNGQRQCAPTQRGLGRSRFGGRSTDGSDTYYRLNGDQQRNLFVRALAMPRSRPHRPAHLIFLANVLSRHRRGQINYANRRPHYRTPSVPTNRTKFVSSVLYRPDITTQPAQQSTQYCGTTVTFWIE
jgi:hypothetical protein